MPETVACNLCGTANGSSQPEKARFLGIPEPLGISCCGRCGFVYLNPRPTIPELAAIYTTHPFYSAENATRGEPWRPFFASRMDRLERWRPQRGTMLGVGCLDGGYALEVAQSRGWSVLGIEFSETLAAHARERLGLEVNVVEAWDLASVAGRRFDVIHSLIFEHLPDARATLGHCRRLLSNQGLLILEVPNTFRSLKNTIRAAVIELAGSKAQRLFYGDAPAEVHSYYFDPGTIRTLLTSEGFEVLELRTYLPRHPVYLANPHLRWLQELIYAVGGMFERGPGIEVIARLVR